MRAILSSCLVTLLVATAACGGGSKKSSTTTPPPGPDTTAPVTEPTTDPATPAGGDGKLTEAQCGELFDHAIAIMLQSATPEERDQFEQNKDQYREMAVPQCVAEGTQATYDCFMKAETQDEMQKCGP